MKRERLLILDGAGIGKRVVFIFGKREVENLLMRLLMLTLENDKFMSLYAV